jgi:hypothetical protein
VTISSPISKRTTLRYIAYARKKKVNFNIKSFNHVLKSKTLKVIYTSMIITKHRAEFAKIILRNIVVNTAKSIIKRIYEGCSNWNATRVILCNYARFSQNKIYLDRLAFGRYHVCVNLSILASATQRETLHMINWLVKYLHSPPKYEPTSKTAIFLV